MTQKFWHKATVQVAIVSAAAVVLTSVVPSLLQLPTLREENKTLRDEVQRQRSEVQRLDILLTPFKTIALERYSGNETEALAKLGVKLQELQAGLETLSNYQDVARLGPLGTTGLVKAPLQEGSPLIELLKNAWEERADGWSPKCTTEAIGKFQEATRRFSDFPFSYYALAVCLKEKGDPEWRGYAEKAASIFGKTTSLKEHQPSQDRALQQLRLLLGQ
jgi:hypothetical protein